MNNIQQRVDNMHKGSVSDIMGGIYSDCLFERLNAIIAGTRIHLLDKKFVDCVKAETETETTLMGVPVKEFAVASLEVLEIQKYSGDNPRVKGLIQCKFNF